MTLQESITAALVAAGYHDPQPVVTYHGLHHHHVTLNGKYIGVWNTLNDCFVEMGSPAGQEHSTTSPGDLANTELSLLSICIGYATKAAQRIGISEDDPRIINELATAIQAEFVFTMPEEAAEAGRQAASRALLTTR